MGNSFIGDLKRSAIEIGNYFSALIPGITEFRVYRHMRRYDTPRKDCLTVAGSGLVSKAGASLAYLSGNTSAGLVLYTLPSCVEGFILNFEPKSF